ncbi:glycosyltransferase [Xanthomonas sacchari]|uniref:glycosyltransferase n=1 Tax=Xanthomonas sacchari TaxID=56458 RepID=UPI00225E2295|nr:glycosyltransferase [Xanthomonas sacchari]
MEVPNVGQPGHSWEAVDSRDSAPYPIDLVFVNPDFFAHVPLHPGNYVIGFWFWELERVPLDWLDAIDAVDEIWVATEYVAHAFRSVTQKPVIVVPHPVPIPLGPVGGIEKPDFDLDPSSFSFLFSFDFNSWVERKNPWAVISAFESAFPRGDEPVQLLIKSSNGVCHAQALRRLLRRVRKDRRIVVRDQILGQNLVDGLQWTVDAYVSLHRAEGFGLGMAEMMAKGKPVAATAWSGNCDYMDETCAGMIGYRLVQVGTDDYLGDGGVWADADVQEAASWMAHISQDRCAAKSLGDAARQAITDRLSVERAVEVMGGRLREIGLLLSSNSSN